MQTIEKTDIQAGQVLRVHQQITEGDKTRTQVFEGTVIKRRGGNTPGASFTIRKKSGNVWIEKVFPIHLPTIEKVELVKEYKKRRAQMTFLRNVKFKKKLKEITDRLTGKKSEPKAEKPTTAPEPEIPAEEKPTEPTTEAQPENTKAQEVTENTETPKQEETPEQPKEKKEETK